MIEETWISLCCESVEWQILSVWSCKLHVSTVLILIMLKGLMIPMKWVHIWLCWKLAVTGHQPLPHDAFGNYWIFFAKRGEKNYYQLAISNNRRMKYLASLEHLHPMVSKSFAKHNELITLLGVGTTRKVCHWIKERVFRGINGIINVPSHTTKCSSLMAWPHFKRLLQSAAH